MRFVTRRKTTVYVREDLLRAAKVAAARTGRKEYEVFEEALERYLGLQLLDRVGRRARLSEAKALERAYRALHAARRR